MTTDWQPYSHGVQRKLDGYSLFVTNYGTWVVRDDHDKLLAHGFSSATDVSHDIAKRDAERAVEQLKTEFV